MEMLKDVQDYMISGGFVMPPLMLLTFALWYQLTERYFILNENKNIKISLRKQLQNVNPYALDYLFLQVQTHMKKGKMTIKAIVGSAPLLGLLGTVNGMITTFDSLGDMTLFSQTGGVAGGISQALITTQMGLCVAIPGVIAGRILDRRETAICNEMEEFKKALLNQETSSAPAS